MSTPLTVEALLDIVCSCSQTITLSTSDGPEWMRTSETMEVIDAIAFRQALEKLIEKEPT